VLQVWRSARGSNGPDAVRNACCERNGSFLLLPLGGGRGVSFARIGEARAIPLIVSHGLEEAVGCGGGEGQRRTQGVRGERKHVGSRLVIQAC
jgi:hypothetical protein